MADGDWVRVGDYPNMEAAEVVSGRLSVEGVQNRVASAEPAGPLFGALGEWSVLVPPESVEEAARILSQPPVTEAELTALALRDPPPDDFDAAATPAGDSPSRDESARHRGD